MSGFANFVSVVFFVCLLSPIFVRYFIVKEPLGIKSGTILSIVYVFCTYFLITLGSTLRMIAYTGSLYGTSSYISSPYYSPSVNIIMVFWQAVFSSIIAALFFYFARFILRKGHDKVEYQDGEGDSLQEWWSSVWIRQLLFFGGLFVLIYIFDVIETAARNSW